MTIIFPSPGRSVELTWEATSRSQAVTPAEVSITWTATSKSRYGAELAWTGYAASAREAVELSWIANASSSPSPPVINPQQLPGVGNIGGINLTDDVQITGAPGDVLSWDYSHDGRNEELQLTVAGLHGLATPTITLEVLTSASGVVVAPLGRLPARQFRMQGAEPEEDHGAKTTSFTFRNSFDLGLRGIKLDELIPWVLDPNTDSWAKQRTVNVSTLVHKVMRQVDPAFSLADDPLLHAAWVEWQGEYSTEGKTPEDVWDDTYGKLGMQLLTVPHGTGIRLQGDWLEPMGTETGEALPESWVVGLKQKRERLQTPTSLTLNGMPIVLPVSTSSLPELIEDAANKSDCPSDKDAAEELKPSNEWNEIEPLQGGGKTYKGYRSLKGMIIASVEYTLQDVVVKENVDGEETTNTFQNVLTSYKETRISTDPRFENRPTQEVTTTKTFGYSLGTDLETVVIAGPSLYGTVQAGYLLTDEEANSTFSYAESGEQSGKTTRYRTLLSVQQENAEAAPADRGPMTAREYGVRTDIERFNILPGNKTAVMRSRGGTTTVPLYDEESGEAVRTAQVTSAVPIPISIFDGRPPSFPLAPGADPCDKESIGNGAAGELRLIPFPVAIRLNSGDAGQAEPQQEDLPFVKAKDLPTVGKLMLTRQWWRIVSSYDLPFALGLYGGATWAGGRVRSVRISKSGGAGVTSSFTVARLDPLMPIAPSTETVPQSKNKGSGLALFISLGSVLIRTVGSIDPQGNPFWNDFRAWFPPGNPPTPGEEVQWRLNPRTGRREVTNG